MTPPTVRGRALGAALVLATGLTLASCTTSGHGTTTSDAQIVASCPTQPISSATAADVSGSFQSDTLKAATLEAIAAQIRRTAICGGHARVFAFMSSTGATTMLYDGDLLVDAPTENARLREAGKLADQVMTQISTAYDTAASTMTGTGSDPLGMLTLFQQANAAYQDHALVNQLITDGVATIGIDPTALPDAASARTLADQQPVPSLAGADVIISGIGKQGVGELPSAMVANLTAFWEQICQNTGAASCSVSTEGK